MPSDIVTTDGEIATTTAPITLFGTDNPVAVVERASTIATALADVIKRRSLYKRIGASDHVFVEGWTLLGSMLGVFAEVEWSRGVDGGWEARAVARTLAGGTVGAAESMCTRSESKWRTADDYAIRSMAQTRAVSKALRLPLGFIMELAGYSATPAEEIANEQPGRGVKAEPDTRPSASKPPAPAPVDRRAELADLAHALGLDAAAIERYADAVGIAKGGRATDEQLESLIANIRFDAAARAIPEGQESLDLPEMP